MKTDESVLDFPKDGLCPDIWEKVIDETGAEETWRPVADVEDKILNIVQMLCEKAGLVYGNMRVFITGSITSNTYNRTADVDVHIRLTKPIREFASMTQDRINSAMKQLDAEWREAGQDPDAVKSWKGHPLQFYYQIDEFQDFMSVGVYDVKNRNWIVGPEFKDPSYNPYSELYKEIQAKAGQLIKDIRDKILDVYEKAVVFTKVHRSEPTNELPQDVVDIAQHAFSDLLNSITAATDLYENARQMRKVYSSPTSIKQALKFRSSRKWKIADAAFKLMDKFGYLAILKAYKELKELISTGDGDLAIETAESILATVKKYISNPEKLADSEKLKESMLKITSKMKLIVESWKPDFDDKPVNQWGERWQKLDKNDWHVCVVEDAAKDCQIDIYEDGPKLERLDINSVHLLYNGNLIVTVFGGANGGEIVGGCNLTYYLSLLRKFVGKLVDGQYFDDAWFIDWDNDCCDDVWTFRFVLHPTDKTKCDMLECGYEVLQVKESIDHDECVKYVNAFKEKLGYRDGYMPTKSLEDVQMSIARECALRLPTDTEAREIQGDAVILLVLSGDDDAVKVGKQLGNELMKNAAHSDEKLILLMSDAYKALGHLETKQYIAKRAAIQKAKDTLPNTQHESEGQIDEGAKDMLTIAALVAMIAIKNICPAAPLEAALKDVPKSEMKATSSAFKQAIAKATKGKSYNGMNMTNIVNCTARTIYAEAKSETIDGRKAIASVLWNRAGGKCGNLVKVISKKAQWSCWRKYLGDWDDKTYTYKIPLDTFNNEKNKKIWDECVQLAIQLANEEFTSTIGNRNIYISDKDNQASKDRLEKLCDKTIGAHTFGYDKTQDGFKKDTAKATYIVKAGDTLSKIAKANKTTIAELQQKNNIKDPNKIQVGQKIQL